MQDLIAITLMLVSGYFIRYSLILSGQYWAKTFGQTVSFFILPIITFVITKTIYGNIALSLGMIGALSIVRFRHPVKSSLELITYFCLITIGIAASVKLNYAALLSFLMVLIVIFVKKFNDYKKKNNKANFYNISFSEGIDLNLLEVIADQKIEKLERNKNLKSLVSNRQNSEIIYQLAFQSRVELDEVKNEINDLESVKKIDVSYL